MFRRTFHKLLVSVLAWGTAVTVFAATEPVKREFDPQKIEEYKKRSEYQYGERVTFPFLEWLERVGERIKRWVDEYFDFDMPSGIGFTAGDLVIYIVAALAVAAVVYLLFKGSFSWLFSRRRFRKKKEEPEYSVYEENIHSINFTDEIEQAIQTRNYRKATRLFYLKSLKLLSDAGHIQWQINKTNTDYRREIASKAIREEFDYLSLAYDYVWYGEFEPSEETFLETFDRFRKFNHRFNPEPAQP